MTYQRLTRDISAYTAEDIATSTPPLPIWSIDFTQQSPAEAGLSFSRASNAGYYNAQGNWVTALSNTLRVAYNPATGLPRGFLCEEQRTNYLLNSATPATQTVSLSTGSYILWLEGSGSCTCAAGTAAGTGFGTATAATPVIFNLTTAGSVIFTVSGSVSRFQCENGTFVTSFIGTAAAAATRAADSCSMSLSSLLNSTEGTFMITTEVGQGMALGIDNGSGGYFPRGHVRASTNQRNLYLLNTSSTIVFDRNDNTNITLGSRINVGLAYYPTGSTGVINGQHMFTSSTPTGSFSATTLRIGSRFLPGISAIHNAAIHKVAYYNKALPLQTLQKITN